MVVVVLLNIPRKTLSVLTVHSILLNTLQGNSQDPHGHNHPEDDAQLREQENDAPTDDRTLTTSRLNISGV